MRKHLQASGAFTFPDLSWSAHKIVHNRVGSAQRRANAPLLRQSRPSIRDAECAWRFGDSDDTMLEGALAQDLIAVALVFRSPSRNTYGFSSSFDLSAKHRKDRLDVDASYALPATEFMHRLNSEPALAQCVSIRPSASKTLALQMMMLSIQSSVPRESLLSLTRIVQSCILIHAMYLLIPLSSDNLALTNSSTRLALQRFTLLQGKSALRFDIRLLLRQREQSSRYAELKRLRVALVHAFQSAGWVADTRDCGATDADPLQNRCSENRAKFALLHFPETSSSHLFGLELARGPAAGHQDLLATTLRRPKSGVLASFALNSRLFRYETAMEPELAFLMASFACGLLITASVPTNVLDPFCGSCSLLAAAAHVGFSECVGVDCYAFCAPDDRLAIIKDFDRLGLVRPKLFVADSVAAARRLDAERYRSSPAQVYPWLKSESYHAVVSDPPYGMKAPFTPNELRCSADRPANAQHESDSAVRALVAIASFALTRGGQLVFFYSQRGRDSAHASNELPFAVRTLLGSHFDLLHALPQRFSATFRRWLVVARKL